MNKSIILGVTGSTAAYKNADIAGGLVCTGHKNNFVITQIAAIFITLLTSKTPSKNKVYADILENTLAKLRCNFVLCLKGRW